jgi:hypothetical protein
MQSDDELTLIKRAIYGPSCRSRVSITPMTRSSGTQRVAAPLSSRIRVLPIGRTSQEGRIFGGQISERVDREEDEPAILFSGAIHADELAARKSA